MTETDQARCALFIRNRDAVRSVFRFQSSYIYPLCAAIYAGQNKPVDAAALQDAMQLLKANVGLFSNFRSLARYPIAAELALLADPQAGMDRALVVYDLLREEFPSSPYLPVAAVTVSCAAEPSAYSELAARTRELYLGMRKSHPLLTGPDDAVYAALLSLSACESEPLLDRMEQCYRLLKPRFFSANAVQALSAVLALSELPAQEACARTCSLYDLLHAAGLKYGVGYELPTLGTLALSDRDPQALVRDMGEVNTYLLRQRGFGAMGIGRRQRLMYAGLLLLPPSDGRMTADAAAVSGTIALIIAQQAAICAAVAASAAASSASN